VKKVVYLVEDQKSAQFRYRCMNVEMALKDSKKWETEWFLKKDIDKVYDALGSAEILVIERQTAKDDTVLKLIEDAKRKNVKVLFDLDDLIFDYRDLPILMRSTNSRNVVYWMGYFWGIRRIAKKVDGFLCTNDFLGKKLKRSFSKPYKVIPNSLNERQIEVSEKCLKEKKHDGFVVGYFSGSPTHVKDFRLIESELVEFLNEHDDVMLKIVGYMDYSVKIKEMFEKGRVQVVRLVDYLKLQKLISEVDVNIAPLVINDFTNCKSELKLFEAAVVETTTIASPTYTFKKAISDGENGFLAKTSEWYDRLEYLYKHSIENQKIAKRAKEYALKHYYGKEFLKEVEEAYDYFAR
jgi:glycosyltransferase involved in cell wall biosynthesis